MTSSKKTFELTPEGLYKVSLVEFGNALKRQGWKVAEHSAFGGVTPGVHSPKGHHPHDEALDITWWKSDTVTDPNDPTKKIGWKAYTQHLGEQLGQLKGAGGQYLQALHPGNEPKGHGTHAHLGVTGGVLALNKQQMQNFGLLDLEPGETATTTTKPTTATTTPSTAKTPQGTQQLPINIFIGTGQKKQTPSSLLGTYADLILSEDSPYKIKTPTFDPMALMAQLSKTQEYS